jgi:hypothetical protein
MIRIFTRLFAIMSLTVLAVAQTSAQTTFFSETFGGGFPANWTSRVVLGNNQPDAAWIHTTVGATGAFATPALASTSAANGWMIFDSDLNCNIGVGQDAWLISPVLNTTGKTTVFIKFQTLYRNFYDVANIRVGTDLNNLSSWATFPVFPGVVPNAYGGGAASVNPQLVNLDISSAAGNRATVYFAFQFVSTTEQGPSNLIGCAYAWQVDDVELVEGDPRAPNDMRVNDFFAFAPNAATPASQVEPFGFIADIRNVGSQAQAASTLTVRVEDSNEQTIFTTSINYGAIATDSTAENVFFPTEFTPPAVPGIYIGSYNLTLASGPDENPDDNVREWPFAITDTIFSKELEATRTVAPAADESYAYGNVFFTPNGNNFRASSVTFRLGNAANLAGRSLTTLLYRWQGDTNGNLRADAAEFGAAPIAFNSYLVQGDEAFNPITIPVDLDGNVIPLENNMYYIIVVQYATDDDQACFLLANDDNDYQATYFYSDSLNRPRYASALDVSNTGSYSLVGFGFDIVPVVRLNIQAITSTQEPKLSASSVTVFPNPARDQATLKFNLDQPSAQVEISVIDVSGKVLEVQRHQNLQRDLISISTDKLPSGAYNVRIRTDYGVTVQRLVVQH